MGINSQLYVAVGIKPCPEMTAFLEKFENEDDDIFLEDVDFGNNLRVVTGMYRIEFFGIVLHKSNDGRWGIIETDEMFDVDYLHHMVDTVRTRITELQSEFANFLPDGPIRVFEPKVIVQMVYS